MTVAEKIARLVVERGWTQDEFARQAGLNRGTARDILAGAKSRLLNTTVRKCADALGLTVLALQDEPLERLVPRVRRPAARAEAAPDPLELATQPELQAWLDRNPDRAARLTPEERDELVSLQGVGGPLTSYGVEHFVRLIERRRELKRQLDVIAGTEYLPLLELFLDLLYEKVQPYRSPERHEG